MTQYQTEAGLQEAVVELARLKDRTLATYPAHTTKRRGSYMNWKDKELGTIGDLLDACYEIISNGSREEASQFMEVYRTENEHADANIGYLSGYCDRDNMDKIQDWFGVAHPVFGNSHPTPIEAFEAGRKWAAE